VTIETCKFPLHVDSQGAIRVENTRVTLDAVVYAFREGASAEEIAERYPALSLGAIYAAITYYLQNRAEVDGYLVGRAADAEQLRSTIESRPEARQFRERLLGRLSHDGQT
jgi:uncharacterized protein (DUF433 family)